MYRALISFSGKISMTIGEVREIEDAKIAEDLEKAGYIEKADEKAKDKQPKKKQ